jgi:hypothetical protein
MSATMARQGGWVQLEQSNMHLALNMAKIAKGGFSQTAIEEMQQQIKNPWAKVQEQQMHSIMLAQHNTEKAVRERHSGMILDNQTDGCLP